MTILLVGVTILVATAVAALVGKAILRRGYAGETKRLIGNARPSRLVEAEMLPEPVRRYLEVTGAQGNAPPRAVRLLQTGGVRTAPGKPWMPLRAEQVYAMEPPGFVWLAEARVAPFVSLLAKDRYIEGRGNMLIRLLGLVTIADARGPEIDQGAGLRYWGEILAFPEMVRSPRLRWIPIDDRRARFVAVESGIEAEIEFDPQGLPVRTRAQRYWADGSRSILTPWSGHIRDWRDIDGRFFPVHWESVWHLPDGDFPAVQLQISRIETIH